MYLIEITMDCGSLLQTKSKEKPKEEWFQANFLAINGDDGSGHMIVTSKIQSITYRIVSGE